MQRVIIRLQYSTENSLTEAGCTLLISSPQLTVVFKPPTYFLDYLISQHIICRNLFNIIKNTLLIALVYSTTDRPITFYQRHVKQSIGLWNSLPYKLHGLFHFWCTHTYLCVTFWIPSLRSSSVHALSLTFISIEPLENILPDDAMRCSRSSPRRNLSLCSKSGDFYIMRSSKITYHRTK